MNEKTFLQTWTYKHFLRTKCILKELKEVMYFCTEVLSLIILSNIFNIACIKKDKKIEGVVIQKLGLKG